MRSSPARLRLSFPADQSGFAASGTDAGAESAAPQTSGSSRRAGKKRRHDRRLAPRPSQELPPIAARPIASNQGAGPRGALTQRVIVQFRSRNGRATRRLIRTRARRRCVSPRARIDPALPPPDEKHRQRASDYDMPKPDPKTGPQRAKVDPNSPFAKLLELRSLLEGRANKRP